MIGYVRIGLLVKHEVDFGLRHRAHSDLLERVSIELEHDFARYLVFHVDDDHIGDGETE